MDSDLVIGLVGALVGGVASLAGSVVVNRLQLRKTMRIRMLEDLVPKLLNAWTHPQHAVMLPGDEHAVMFPGDGSNIANPQLILDRLMDLRRVAIVSAPKDTRRVNKLLRMAALRSDLYESLQANDLPGQEDEQKRNRRRLLLTLDAKFTGELHAFIKYLESKMHWLQFGTWALLRPGWRVQARSGRRVHSRAVGAYPYTNRRLRAPESS